MATKSPKPAKRQHFIARFYLRNFAEPLFSDNLCVYDVRKRRWERRTPDGVGWFPHLFSVIDDQGTRTDAFDQFLKLNVEDPAVPAMKRLAAGEVLEGDERFLVASFIALTAARSPDLMTTVIDEHLHSLAEPDRAELDDRVRMWCDQIGRPVDSTSYREYLKPRQLEELWRWSGNFREQLLQWKWHFVRTTRNEPFVTSDRPVLMQRDGEVRLVSLPVSTEVALVIITGGAFNEARDRTIEAHAMNRGTMDRAKEFVVACRESFPGDEFLTQHSRPVD